MFALWYLSFAIDEIRKHFGWSSVFDIFKSKKTASTKAIDDKPSATPVSKPAEPKKPEVPKIPEPKPQVTTKPVEPPKVTPTLPKVTIPEPKAPEPKIASPEPVVRLPEPKPAPKPEPPKPAEIPKPAAAKPADIPKPEAPKPADTPKPADPPKPTTPKTPIAAIPPAFTPDSLDKKLTGNLPRTFENGDRFAANGTKSSTNIKDATSSFLEGEGSKNPAPRQHNPVSKR